MNLIEQVHKLPDWDWMPKSEQEMMLTGQGIIDQTDMMWTVGNVAVVGFIYRSMLSPPWMWFALSRRVGIADLIDFRRLTMEIPKGTTTAVDAEFKTGLRFAKLYGFEETGEVVQHFERNYKIMRRK